MGITGNSRNLITITIFKDSWALQNKKHSSSKLLTGLHIKISKALGKEPFSLQKILLRKPRLPIHRVSCRPRGVSAARKAHEGLPKKPASTILRFMKPKRSVSWKNTLITSSLRISQEEINSAVNLRRKHKEANKIKSILVLLNSKKDIHQAFTLGEEPILQTTCSETKAMNRHNLNQLNLHLRSRESFLRQSPKRRLI